MAGAFLWLLLQLYGGSAQNFGSSRPNWLSYGWAAFAVPAKPAGSPLTKARLEVGCYAIQVLAASVHRYLLLPNIPTVVCSTQLSRAIGGMQCCGTSSSSASVRLAKSIKPGNCILDACMLPKQPHRTVGRSSLEPSHTSLDYPVPQ